MRAHDLSKVLKQNANLLKQSIYYPLRKKKQKQCSTEQDWKRIFNNWYKIENKNIRPALLARNYAKGPEADCYDAYLRYRRQHSRWKFAI